MISRLAAVKPNISTRSVHAPAAEKRSFTIRSATVSWQPIDAPGLPKGLTQKLLHDNKQNQLQSAIIRMPKGYREPRHYHKTCGHLTAEHSLHFQFEAEQVDKRFPVLAAFND